jgi:LysM repeat protein
MMSKKLGLIVLVVLALSVSACVQPASTLPPASPTVNGDFPEPLDTGGMGVVEIAASQTALALTGVPQGTPVLVVNDGTITATPTATLLGGLPEIATLTPEGQGGFGTAMPSPTFDPNAPPPNTPLPTVQTTRPATHVLQEGEFVYCLARRFDVDPDEVLALNGIFDSEPIYPGMTLKIPSTGSFPTTPRAWHVHPATYVVKADDTIYSVACYYGDVDPLNIAAVNGLTAPYTLTVGAQIQIP